jgi:hypothetical protein
VYLCVVNMLESCWYIRGVFLLVGLCNYWLNIFLGGWGDRQKRENSETFFEVSVWFEQP